MRRHEDGFTLIELLVVILIIGVLAAIALPTFLSQQTKGHDADAKSMARNLVTKIEECVTETQTYTQCRDAQLAGREYSVTFGTGPGEVTVAAADTATWTITATSIGETEGVNHVFTIRRLSASLVERSCTPAGKGGCGETSGW